MQKKYLLPKIIFIISFLGSIFLLFYFSVHTTKDSFLENIMGISGLLGVVLMTRQSILGVRSIVAARIKDFFRVNARHKWLGIGTLISILLHPFLIEVAYNQQGIREVFTNTQLRIQLGEISRTILIVILVSSFILRTKIKQLFLRLIERSLSALNKTTWAQNSKSFFTTILTLLKKLFISYRLWFWLHLLSYLALAGVRLHAWFSGIKINTIPSVHIYWIVLGCIILLTGMIRLAQALGILQKRGKILSNTQITKEIFEMSIQFNNKVIYSHGQFVYLQHKSFGEAHPFTVLTYDKGKNIMRIAYKISGPFTKKISLLKPGETLLMDGPYGVFTSDISTHNFPIICIAGGIGITPFYHLIKNDDKKNLTLIYLNRNFGDGAYEIELDKCLGDRIVHVYSRETIAQANPRITSLIGKTILGKRIDKSIIQETTGKDIQNTQFYICGSPEVIQSTKDLLKTVGIKSDNIHWETFGM